MTLCGYQEVSVIPVANIAGEFKPEVLTLDKHHQRATWVSCWFIVIHL
ncbi:hypothetical protein CCP3SC1_360011 [Gammaproteobacteria bacterium]